MKPEFDAMPSVFLLSAAVSVLLATTAIANEEQASEVVYVDRVGGVYTQTWAAEILGAAPEGRLDVYVTGEGKLGNFLGVLSVNCAVPKLSIWYETAGFLNEDDLPIEAIKGIRALACNK